MGLSNQSRLALHISEEELDDLVTEGLVAYEDASFGNREGFAWFLTDEGRKALESSVVPYLRIVEEQRFRVCKTPPVESEFYLEEIK